MKVFLKSDVECTVDGVGLLEPGNNVAVDLEMFKMYHNTTPAKANFPKHITVTYDTDSRPVGSSEAEAPDNTEPPATNIGSGNDEETHQDEKSEEA